MISRDISLEGFIIDCHSPSETTLEVEIDCSMINWENYRHLIIDLEDLLSDIDERHSVRSWLVRGRSLRARYRRVSEDDRRRKLRFCPFPSKFQNMLTNARSTVYTMVNLNCIVLERVGARKIYLLPKPIAPAFIESIDRLNKTVVEPLRKEIEEFRNSKDFFAIEACLTKYGADPSPLRRSVFSISRFLVDILPVDFSYSIDKDELYQKMMRQESIRGLELLKKQIEKKYREYSLAVSKEIIHKLTELTHEYDRAGKIKSRFKRRWRKLMELCESLGLQEIVESFIKPVCEILDKKKADRSAWMMQTFGTTSLYIAMKKAIPTIQ